MEAPTLTRRGFLGGLMGALAGAVAAPAIVKATSLMDIRDHANLVARIKHVPGLTTRDVTDELVREVLGQYDVTVRADNTYGLGVDHGAGTGRILADDAHLALTCIAYNQRTGLWEDNITKGALAYRPELLADNVRFMGTREWVSRRIAFQTGGNHTSTPQGTIDEWAESKRVFGPRSIHRIREDEL